MRTILRIALSAVAVLLSLILVIIAVGEYVTTRGWRDALHARTEWFETRGRRATDWKECVRLGVALRKSCAQDASCGDDVTRLFTADCYYGRYHAAADREVPGPPFAYQAANQLRGGADQAVHYRQPGDSGYVTPRDFSQTLCTQQLPELPVQLCVQEITAAIEKLDRWGAGP